MKLPALFLGHGSPMLLIDPKQPSHVFRDLGRALPRPEKILVLSAHWTTKAPTVGNASRPETIHDFGGFPKDLYAMTYPCPGDPGFAAGVAERLARSGMPAEAAPRGLDHGAWIPLALMYPEADIPVVQLSVQPALGPAHHWAMGEILGPLRHDGVLVIGSGTLVHNLYEIDPGAAAGKAMDWASDFSKWLSGKIVAFDRESLEDYRRRAPHAERAHPTDEHLLPLFAAMGAASPAPRVEYLDLGFYYGTLLMDSYLFW